MVTASFTAKQLRVTFMLSNGATFGNSNNDTLVLTGLRTIAEIEMSQFPAFPQAHIRVYGMLQSDMYALQAIAGNYGLGFEPNTMLVEANSGSGWGAVFAGQIMNASPNYSGAPNVYLDVVAQAFGFQLLNSAPPSSYPGPTTSVAQIVSDICAKMGCAFENDGVDANLYGTQYFAGTLANQLQMVCNAAGIECYPEFGSASTEVPILVAIAPKGQPRSLPVWVISPQTGLLGYPQKDSRGFISLRALFNPAYRFGSQLDLSNIGIPTGIPGQAYLNVPGNWVAYQLKHTLHAVDISPSAPWYTDILAYPPGSLQP